MWVRFTHEHTRRHTSRVSHTDSLWSRFGSHTSCYQLCVNILAYLNAFGLSPHVGDLNNTITVNTCSRQCFGEITYTHVIRNGLRPSSSSYSAPIPCPLPPCTSPALPSLCWLSWDMSSKYQDAPLTDEGVTIMLSQSHCWDCRDVVSFQP